MHIDMVHMQAPVFCPIWAGHGHKCHPNSKRMHVLLADLHGIYCKHLSVSLFTRYLAPQKYPDQFIKLSDLKVAFITRWRVTLFSASDPPVDLTSV